MEKEQLEKMFGEVQKEAQELLAEKNAARQRVAEIDNRLKQLEGSLQVLVPLLKRGGTLADKLDGEAKKTTKKKKKVSKKSS